MYDAIILGGGAAGLFCAAEAGKLGKRVVVLERNAQVGRKILISGGGRCNFTNLSVTAENFVSQNPHFAKSALARYTPQDFIGLVRKHRVQYYEKKLGQLFCRESSKQIVDMLLAECRVANVRVVTGCSVETVVKNNEFYVTTDQGVLTASNLVVATGGLSFPKVGATDLGYRIARQFGLQMVETRPSLVPLVLARESYRDLAGVSADVRISADDATFRENILFTHRGMSGPAILQVSNYWKKRDPVSIDLLPDVDVEELFAANRRGSKHLATLLSDHMPARVAERLTRRWSGRMISSLSDNEITSVSDSLKNWQVRFSDTEGYDRAEVTLGGVSTDEISSKTFESNKVPGLYFIGEVVDVTGWLGGYNFQWAWASAHAAAESL